MDHSFGDLDLSPTSYQDPPIFSPNPFEQLDREDFADGIIQPDASNSQFPAATQTAKPNPSMDHSFILEPFDVEDLLGDKDDDSNGAQPDMDPAEDTAAPMEIAHLEEVAPLQVNVDPGHGHQGPHPAGGVRPPDRRRARDRRHRPNQAAGRRHALATPSTFPPPPSRARSWTTSAH